MVKDEIDRHMLDFTIWQWSSNATFIKRQHYQSVESLDEHL